MKTDPIRLEQLMQKIAGSDLIETNATANGTPLLVVAAESIVRVLLRFKEEPSLDFEQLVDIAAVDWPDRAPRFEMVYTLLSLSRNRRLHIMVRTEAETPVPSAVGVYPSAGWCEREIWDLFGIRFSDHPDLRRILTEYDFDGHPLRKDFP
ncbi:MAG: NADH-quinone oxidoreductase subunit C, partial [Pseudomonadota bacterium]|nr:NADH-quinone oxidoreductase subunit C [Pseudomonadota bacterium]